jgi:deoxyribonuclease-4
MNIKLGAHLSISGGFDKALQKVIDIGGNCLQIFSSSPRGWRFAQANEQQIAQFVNLKSRLKIDPVYFHASYLINLADEGKIGHLSKMSLIAEMNLAEKMQIKGSIVHLGSFKNKEKNKGQSNLLPENYLSYDRDQDKKYKVLIDNIKEILTKTPKEVLFIIENSGNRKIGQTLEEISRIIKSLNDERVRLCLDTCHLFSNGYKFENEKELAAFLDRLKQIDLIDKLELWHVNDSRDPFNSGKDRHANIGQGTIATEEFYTLLNHPQTENYPFIIETPGFDNQGPDKKNLDILKSLINA